MNNVMKTLFSILLPIAFLSAPALAAKNKKAPARVLKKNSSVPADTKLETTLSFEGSKIKGKVQEASLRKIVVENDKSLEDLLGVRKQFDDRRREETERAESW